MNFNNFYYLMNSSELLNALNKQSHNKHNKNKSALMEPISEKQQVFLNKQNQFSEIRILPSEIPNPPNFLLQILGEQEKQQLVNSSILQQISKARKQKQKNVFLAYNDSHIAYLSQLKQLSSKKNEHAANCINDVILRRYNNVTGDLENGKLIINHDRSINTKEQIEKFAEIDRARLIKIKQGAIRSKMDLLNMKMDEMELIHQSPKNQSIQAINKKIEENLDLTNYNLESQKTKIAKDYVKYMSEQRKERRKRQQLRQQRRQKVEQQRLDELKQAEQMKDLSKKQQILQRIQQKRKKRQQQQKLQTQKQQKIEQFLQKYRQQIPIYKKKQRQYQQKVLKPEKAYRQQKLKQIKQKKKSYSLNDIIDHEKKYEQIKRKQLERKLTQKQMYTKSLKINNKQYYKGSVHKYVEEVDKKNKQKQVYLYQLGKNRYERMIDYSKQVKEDFKPKVDQNKRSQLLKLLEFQSLKDNKIKKRYKPVVDSSGEQIGVQSFYEKIEAKNKYKEGNRFMQEGNLKRKKVISQSVQVPSITKTQTEAEQSLKMLQGSQTKQRSGQQNQKQIWRLRSKQLVQMSNNLNSPKQFEQLKINFENLDKRAADKQIIMKHSKMSVQQFIQQKGALDQFYLQSIKNKMKLLE